MVSRSRWTSTSKSARLRATRAARRSPSSGASSAATSCAECPPRPSRWTRLTISSPRDMPRCGEPVGQEDRLPRRLGLGRGDDQEGRRRGRAAARRRRGCARRSRRSRPRASGRSCDRSPSMSTPVTRAKIEKTRAVERPKRRAVRPAGGDEHLQRPSFQEAQQPGRCVEEVQRVARRGRVEHDHVEVALVVELIQLGDRAQLLRAGHRRGQLAVDAGWRGSPRARAPRAPGA